jgi:hypothetical protein
MQKVLLFFLLLSGVLLASCGGQPSGITLAPDKLTFLFFYTDG